MKRMQIVAKDPLPVNVKNGIPYLTTGFLLGLLIILSIDLSIIMRKLNTICENQVEMDRRTQEALACFSWRFNCQHRSGDTQTNFGMYENGKTFALLHFSTNFINEVSKCKDGNLNR